MLGEVATLFKLTARAVRYYEQLGLIQPRRDELNRRVFSTMERTRLQVIALLRAAGLPLRDVRKIIQGIEVGEGRALATELLRRRGEALQRELAGLHALEEQVARLLET